MSARLPLRPPPTQVEVRRLSDGQLIAKLPRFGFWLNDIAFSPDGRYLVAVWRQPVHSHGSRVVVWEWKGKK